MISRGMGFKDGALIPTLGALGLVVVMLLGVTAGLVISGVPDRYAACDDLGGKMARSACVLPDGRYVDPLVYKKGDDDE